MALERVRTRLEEGRADAKIIRSLVEALRWVTAADETLMAEYGGAWTAGLRADLSERSRLEGLRWVRNQVAPQIRLWEATNPPFHWAEANALSTAGDEAGRAHYVQTLQRQPTLETLKSVVNAIRDAALRLPS